MPVLTLSEAKAHLNITTTADDEELVAYMAAAERAVANEVGPLSPTTVTARVRGGGTALVLPTVPILSLTSVTPATSLVELVLADLDFDARAGFVEYLSGARFSLARHTVVYVAGWQPLPEDMLLAVKELTRHYWTTQRAGGGSRPGSRPSEGYSNAVPGAAFSMPFRVAELLAPYRTVGLA